MMKKLLILFFCLAIASKFLVAQKARGLEFDDVGYKSIPAIAQLTRNNYEELPTSASIKEYCPKPGNQIGHSTSVGWALCYGARTIIEAKSKGWKDINEISRNTFSPVFIYHLVKSKDDEDCSTNIKINDALAALKTRGTPKYIDFQEFCPSDISDQVYEKAKENTISGYVRLYDKGVSAEQNIKKIKKSISEGFPVVMGMVTPPSFDEAKEFWQPRETYSDEFKGHAMCVVGYDDSKYGGAFEVMNSWGKTWGNEGYMWIPYNFFTEFTKYAFAIFKVNNEGASSLSGEMTIKLTDNTEMPVKYEKNNGAFHVQTPYSSGTLFRLYITNHEPAFLYAFGFDKTLKTFQIFPSSENINPALMFKASSMAIPSEEGYVQMDQNIGKDYLCVLYSTKEISLPNILAKVEKEKGDLMTRLKAVIGPDIIPSSEIDWSADKIEFKAKTESGSLVVMMVSIDHI